MIEIVALLLSLIELCREIVCMNGIPFRKNTSTHNVMFEKLS